MSPITIKFGCWIPTFGLIILKPYKMVNWFWNIDLPIYIGVLFHYIDQRGIITLPYNQETTMQDWIILSHVISNNLMSMFSHLICIKASLQCFSWLICESSFFSPFNLGLGREKIVPNAYRNKDRKGKSMLQEEAVQKESTLQMVHSKAMM